MADVDFVIMLVSLVAVALLVLLLATVRHYRLRVEALESRVTELASQKQSLSTTYGRITEQFAPFLPRYPYDARGFRFLGSPVDGVQFEADRIVFVEIKTASSHLTPGQAHARRLVEEGRVQWFEFRVDDSPPPGWTATPAPEPAAPPEGSPWGAER